LIAMPAPIQPARGERVMSDRIAAQLTDFPETIDLAFAAKELPGDGRHEPPAASTARRADVTDVARLDPTRTDFDSDPKPPERRVLGGPIASLLFHLVPLLALVTWMRPPLQIPPPIPIQLVVEQPPPPPPAPQPALPKPEPKPPPGRRASDDMGEVGPPKPEKGADIAPPTSGEPQPPAAAAEAKPIVAPPEPPPEPAPVAAEVLPPPPPKPAPPKREAAVPLPKPDGWILPFPLNANQTHEASRSARFPGPAASRDEYCAYALTLALQHINLLPLSLLGARHGDTAVAIVLHIDGSIDSVRVVRGSDYSDIDERVVQMVWAVGRFPPLPSWVPGPLAQFTFHLHFPNPSER
jgi:TonB family protein